MFRISSKSTFSKHVITLMSGTAIAQIIPIAISPLLTRLYDPDAFGVWALYMALLAVASIISTGRYEHAILLPKKQQHAKGILVLCLTVVLSYALGVLFVVLFAAENISQWLESPDLAPWLYLLPVHIAILGAYQTFYYWNNRVARYKNLAKSKILQSSASAGVNISLGIAEVLKNGLILGSLIGNFTALTYLLYRSFRKLRNQTTCTADKILVLARRYRNFPKFMIASGLIETLAAYMPIFLFGKFYGTTVIGLYILSQRIVKVPITFVASAFADVFKQEASKQLKHNGNCTFLFRTTFKKLLLISTVPFLALFFSAPYLFGFVFGEQWHEAGIFVSILTPMFYLQFVSSPLSSMFMVAEKQQLDLYMQIFLLVGVVGIILAGSMFFDDIKTVLVLFSGFYCLKYLIELKCSYEFSKGVR